MRLMVLAVALAAIGPASASTNAVEVVAASNAVSAAALAHGIVWRDAVLAAGERSREFPLGGFERRVLYLVGDVVCDLETDRHGDGEWRRVDMVTGRAGEITLMPLDFVNGRAARLVARSAATNVTAVLDYARRERRSARADLVFEGLARRATSPLGDRRVVFMPGRGTNELVLADATPDGLAAAPAVPRWRLVRLEKGFAAAALTGEVAKAASPACFALPSGCALAAVTDDAASVVVVDHAGRRWRLPRQTATPVAAGEGRLVGEACAGLDLANVGGTFYELPRAEFGGCAALRPIATHDLETLYDFRIWQGFCFLSGIERFGGEGNPRLYGVGDSGPLFWAGKPSELVAFGKPRGQGGPWLKTAVVSGEPSEPYLMNGYDAKFVMLAADRQVNVRLELDLTGDRLWAKYKDYSVNPGQTVTDDLSGVRARWVRAVADTNAVVSVQFVYR